MNFQDPKLLELLRCPVKHTKLTSLSEQQIEDLNESIRSGNIKDRQGQAVTEELTAGVVNSDQSCAYAIRGGIIQLIPDEAILLENLN